MTSLVRAHDLILCLTPFGEPDAALAAAACAAGAFGVLDLGTGDRRSREELSRLRRAAPGRFGVRVTGRCALDPTDLAGGPDTVILAPDAPWPVNRLSSAYRVLAEVTDSVRARQAVRDGAHGLIARGAEAGGRVGELSTFVLLQQLLADEELDGVPVWACGGVGPHTAAAAVAGGAAGVVLDSQLALLAESSLPESVRAALRSLDGSETVVLGGHRVLRRRGPGTPRPPADDPETVASLLGARDLRTQLLPVGQDGFLAARFADRWADVRGVVSAVSAAIQALADAASADGAGLANGSASAEGAGLVTGSASADGADLVTGSASADGADLANGSAPADGAGLVTGSASAERAGLVNGSAPADAAGREAVDRRDGTAGPSGADGASRAAGPGGFAGPGGVAGASGADGPTGLAGASGADGPSRAAGPSGADGASRAAGPGGFAGPTGVAGASGADGPSRADGPTGADGPARTARPHGPAGVEYPAFAGALRPGSGMSRALGTRLPVAQGPMTRVSDQAGFAAAVARDGALPFLALALADGERTRSMLTEARAVLDGRPWGVGVLGFAPEDIRNAQLEAVRELRPTHAIIAGGRPAQAEALERAGIRTFLHVPSPGLLRQFLDAGARRFVFEGSECGGHVGPRASFPLWEAQLAAIEDFLADTAGPGDDAAHGLEIFFAGGIHDERSAAMVAALAAPLTARGAAVGVLMGTAYLFTDEAVAHGAVQPLFQHQVLAATATALLETAPGHATRCVPSPFTHDYRDREAALRTAGVPDREVWETLERLNVGRLRIASKGLERTADGALRTVAEQRQLTDGMFMAGEVAVLRTATTTMADLHRSVTDGAADFLAARTAPLARAAHASWPNPGSTAEPLPPAPLDVAIVGMACMFPQAPDLATFWANVVSGHDAVTEVPPDRWDPAVHQAAGSTASVWGGFLPRIPFDPLRYGIPPTSLGSIEPVQLLSLEAARRALDDAGYGAGGREFDRARTSVVFGAEAGSDLSNAVTLRAVLPAYYGRVPDGLDEQLPRLTEDSFPGMLANVISGRIANRLDLGGANYTVDAACASSLAALDVACKELVSGISDVVLCGGADLHNGINDYVLFSSVHALSPTGRSRAFDASADGIALGEGVACVVLKRLADAERAGDRIYGVVRGLGSASDGRSLGLTAPRPEGQRAALERAYRNAGVSPADVGLVEAHGTGTVVGDRTELAVLAEVFTESGARAAGCALGSVKSQIGHTKCAAGLAGLIKTTLALYTGVTPPTVHLERPNPAWAKDDSPFVFHTRARPWTAPAAERLAGVSAFGFGGTNFHAVLSAHEGAPPPRRTLDAWPAELFLFRGRDTAAAHREVTELLRAVEAEGRPWRLRDLALAAAHRADTSNEPVRAALVSRDTAELAGQLRRVLAGEHDPAAGIHLADRTDGDAVPDAAHPADPAPAGKMAFLFPGQGSQRTGMLGDLLIALPELRHYLHLGHVHEDLIYPPAAFDDTARERHRTALTDTRTAQPALGITGLAAHAFLTAAGVRPDMAAGHSYGELAALAAAGALDPETLLELSAERAEAILAAAGDEPGTMAAVGAGAEDVVRALRAAGAPGSVVVANLNSPEQTVISGPTVDVDTAVRLLRTAGLGARRIPVACAFHSPLVSAAGERFAEVLAERTVRPPEFPVWANRTAAPYPHDPDGVRAELAAQIGSPVGFAAQIRAMYAAGARTFVEAGPGTVLTRLVGQILGDRPHRTIACEPRADSGLPGWLDALARLAVAGVPVQTAWLLRGRDAVDALRTPVPERPGWTVDGHLVRTADGAPLSGALAPARRVLETTVTTDQPYGAPADRDALISEFLRTSREMIAAQRDVLLTYFGAGPAAPAAPPLPPQQLPAAPVRHAVAPPEPEPATAGGDTAGPDVERLVLQIISERTGYPVDMIEPDLDLEADLSIDSIKRAEIAGELAKRLGIADGAQVLDDAELEELAKARTAAAVTHWLTARTGADPGGGGQADPPVEQRSAPSDHGPEQPTTPPGEGIEGLEVAAPRRLELRPVPLPAPQAADPDRVLAGRRFVLLGGGAGDGEGPGTEEPAYERGTTGVAEAVAARLTGHGADVRLLGRDHLLAAGDPALDGPPDGVVYLGAFTGPDAPVLPDAFPVVRAALARGPRRLLAVRTADRSGSPRSAGLDGLFRTVAREYPDLLARVVAVPDTSAPAVADAVLAELLAPEPAPVVLRTADGARQGLELTPAPLGPLGGTGAGPAGEGAAEAAALGLDRDSVVLLVGGARGITARFAATLATASRCRIELLGRTPAPTGPEPASTAAARTPVELRAALAAGPGAPKPAEIDRAARLILAQREITTTLAELTAHGSAARYRSVDFRERDAVLQAVKEIHAEHGRLDGVVFAAGIIEDRLIAEKTPESFQRVYGTKTAGAAALFAALDDLPSAPAFTVLFGSIAAVLGNRGQADYAAANDALETLGARWAARTGNRALTVHWGPWAPSGTHTGMVGAELGREYARRGVRLIDPDEGTAVLLRELAWGDPAVRAVVHTASGW
ncbi:type I polyketide synthase [Streptomyces sp. PanSC9]|uniref:type I polyketide synthase n=1 Tax=Streptomyces sp. PanSC9 TaxID=1520461 RepID=UPI000F49FDAF|nr:type I polyketide synthase [Streptomyces sp. PanSC9]ROP54646.1 acyl transferase domain-containing protein [Streptomyces sp. PanSC9]